MLFSREIVVFSIMLVCCAGTLGAAAVSFIYRRGRRSEINVTLADILVIAYLLVGVLNVAFIKKFAVDPMVYWRWLTMAFGYILLRILCGRPDADKWRNFVLYALVAVGVVQAAIAIGQCVGWIASNHRMFDVTGSFGNPGQLGGFLAVTFTAAVALAVENTKRSKPIFTLWLTASLGILYALKLADSRAAYLAVAGGVILVCWPWIAQAFKKQRKIAIPVAITVGVVAAAMLFNYRPGSANARLLVWRVSADMMADSPVTGHGVGAFNEKYMLYQAEYFQSHSDSRFVMVADNVAYPYNEFLHMLVEQGIIGLMVLLALLGAVLLPRNENWQQRGMKSALVALLIFSMFSYPSYVFPLLFLFAILIGSLDSKPVMTIRWPRWTPVVKSVAVIAFGVISIQQIGFYREASRQVRQLFRKENAEAIGFVDDNYGRLRHNLTFNGIYASYLAEHADEPGNLELLLDRLPSCETWCDIGNAYVARARSVSVGVEEANFRNENASVHRATASSCEAPASFDEDFTQAEEYYRTAAAMIPTRLMPNYLLWKLYLEKGDIHAAESVARQMLAQPLKVENTFTIRAKTEVKRWLCRF